MRMVNHLWEREVREIFDGLCLGYEIQGEKKGEKGKEKGGLLLLENDDDRLLILTL